MDASTRPVARAAPVEVGTMLTGAARARRRSRWARSSRFWSLVMAWTVVVSPFSTPKASSSTLTIGTKQLVVQEALETMLCWAGSKVIVIDPDDEGGVDVGGRRRDDDPGAPASMWAAASRRR